MDTPEELNTDTPENPTDSEQDLSEEVDARQKAMKATNKDVMNHTPPPAQEPAGNAREQPQRRLG